MSYQQLGKDAPLRVAVQGDQLVIRIGIDTLAFSAEHCQRFYDPVTNAERPYVRVVDNDILAIDVRRELLREEEDGTNPLHVVLDNAIVAAFGNGSLAFKDSGR